VTDQASLGVLEVTPKGAGFLRRPEHGYLPGRDDVHVGRKVLQQFRLRTGDEINAGEVGHGGGRGKSKSLLSVAQVNGRSPEELAQRPQFNELTAIHPNQQLTLDCNLHRLGAPDFTNRVIDLISPVGLGQRAMIVAPAKAGKTMVLQALAEGISKNRPGSQLLILLVDERPEEVTEMEACGYGEVIASTFDFPASRHVAVAELTLERARRRVELGQDVVIILDSITRLARAYNRLEKGSGRTLSGGLDATAMERPKRFLGSARNIDPRQGGGSLTIIGTARPHRHRLQDGPGDLRGVQGHRQQRDRAQPRAVGAADLPRDRHQRQRHPARGAAPLARDAGGEPVAEALAGQPASRVRDEGAARADAAHQGQRGARLADPHAGEAGTAEAGLTAARPSPMPAFASVSRP